MPVLAMLRWAKGTATERVTQVAGWGRTSWQRASPWTWSGLHENTDPRYMYEDPDPTTDGEDSGSDGDEEGLSLSRNYGEVAVSPRVVPDRSQLLVPDETEFGELFQESRARCYTALQLNLGPFLAVWWGVLFGLVHFLNVSVVYPLIALLYRGLGQPMKTCFREFLKGITPNLHDITYCKLA
ncbi:Hypp5884 [Branchiostoma lanceolatum]|uniref:Hypp5884 protein n=1 Tax=Branchiostoma lanceolatum TaxID=7740 RepID=A0A8J9W566_BRALA|nr:Hypp5884 [Branchiostoma lanceolatum]